MAPLTESPRRPASATDLPDSKTVGQLDPERVHVIEIDGKGQTFQRDCYDPNGGFEAESLDGIQELFRTVDGHLHVRTIDWARTSSLDPDVELHWAPTGMHVDDVEQIRIFSWPDGTLRRVFRHTP